jgi:hypothetical protein
VAIRVILPFDRETENTVVYAVSNLKSLPVGQVYINKEHLEKINGEWPTSITLTIEWPTSINLTPVEPGDTTR